MNNQFTNRILIFLFILMGCISLNALGEEECTITVSAKHNLLVYATNSTCTIYGNEASFITPQSVVVPSVTTDYVFDITLTSATGGGTVTDDGGAEVTERGVCWSTSHNPTTSSSHAQASTGGTGSFTCIMTGLTPGTTFYVRAYAKNSAGTAYGSEVSFVTLPNVVIPSVTTNPVTNITQTTATGCGTVTSDGGATVTERGICWSTSHNPTLSSSHAQASTGGTGSFTCNMTGLTAGTTFYVRAYAKNSAGTAYGNEVSFVTPQSVVVPSVTTNPVTNITQTTATGGGTVTNDGGAEVTERGICWSTSHNPTISSSHAQASTGGTGSFTCNMTGLTAGTTFYVRAYAKNSAGTAYGSEVSFVTLPNVVVPSVTTNPVTNITQTTATGGGTVTSDGGATVTERGICWSTSHNPTINGSHAQASTGGTGSFTCNMTGLTAGSTYFVRAYAANSEGIGYGGERIFTTLQVPTYTISVSANPNNGGTVSGGGTYQQGQSCTVTATANSGFTFTNWTENGNVVSNNANYTFTVTGNRTLVAHFAQLYTISVSASPTQGGMVSGGGQYQYGQQCTVHATASDDYVFTNWTENGNVVSTEAHFTFTVTGNRTLVAHFNRVYTIRVLADPEEGGEVSGNGTYQHGQSCTVIATSTEGYRFVRWTENNVEISTDPNFTFTVISNSILVAKFEELPPNTYYINVSPNPPSGGTVTGGGSFPADTTITVRAIVNEGYRFTNWTENGNIVSNNADYTFTVTGNRNLIANFTQQQYNIEVSAYPADGGDVSGGGTFHHGESHTVHASANLGFTFTNWTENDSVVSTLADYHFLVERNRTLVANFEKQGISIEVSANPEEGGTVSGGGVYVYGINCTVQATPNDGFEFENWTENDIEVSNEAAYTFTVTSDRNLVSNFTPAQFSINVETTEGGSISVDPNEATAGTTITITVNANAGYELDTITVYNTDNPSQTVQVTNNELNYEFTMPNYSVTVKAEFTSHSFIITASSSSHGSISPEGDVYVELGESITYTLIPEEGCEIRSLMIDDHYYTPTESITFYNVSCNHTIHAEFNLLDVEENEIQHVKVSPNPVKEKAVVECQGMRRITVYNLSGIVVYDMETQNDSELIVLEKLSSGIYLMKVMANGNCYCTKLIVSE